jgi:hypothetical protein
LSSGVGASERASQITVEPPSRPGGPFSLAASLDKRGKVSEIIDPAVGPTSEVAFGDLPMSAFIRRLTALSAAGVFLDGYDLTIISVALLFIKPQFHPSSFQVGFIGAAAVVGMFFGALVLGNLTDRVGRRTMYLLDLLFFVVFAIAAAVSESTWELILFWTGSKGAPRRRRWWSRSASA